MQQQLELPGISTGDTLRAVLTSLIQNVLVFPDIGCKKQHTLEMHVGHSRYLMGYFGETTPIGDIGHDELLAYYRDELRRGLSPESVRKRLSTLHMAMKHARARKLIRDIPQFPTIKQRPRPLRNYWLIEDWEKVHAECDDDDFRTWIAVGFWTGMHTSDLNRMRWQDFNEFNRTWIRRNTKNDEVPVPLEVPEELYKILVERKTNLQPHTRDLIAGRNMGHPNKALKNLADRAGVPAISPIGLRHSCATWLTERGYQPAHIQLWLGHKDQRMLERVYRHVTERIRNMRTPLALVG
ncbi:MAG TPA: tyrosine-type recombinase/integrase [Salinarimonas sp.]|nr:tyrosine-type recombinase/integrase [Salinarimonas sp.]